MPTVTKSASSNGVVSGTAFTNPTNAYTDDASVATLASSTKNVTVGTHDWGFAAFSTGDIPDGSTITQVRVVADIRLTATGTGFLVGLQGAISNTAAGGEVTETGTTLVRRSSVVAGVTLANLRSAGVVEARIRYTRGNSSTASTAEVEYAQIEVDYSTPVTHELAGNLTGTASVTGDLTVDTPGGGATPAYQSHTSAPSTGATWTGTEPSGTAQGDYLLAHLAMDSPADSVVTPPSGWTLINGPVDSAADARGYLYGIVRGASAPSYQWAMSSGSDGSLHIVRYSGVDGTSPVNANDATGTASGSSHASPSITPSVNGCLIVGFAHVDKSGTQTPYWLPPTGYDERYDHEDTASFIESTSADKVQTTAAAVSVTFTGNDSDEGVVFIVALRPAAGGPTTHELAASIGGGAATTGAVAVYKAVTGTAPGTATTSATAAVYKAVAGTAPGTATTSATAAITKAVVGSAAGSATATGTATAYHNAAGQATGAATASGSTDVLRALSGTAAGGSAASAGLSVDKPLSASVTGTATAAAALSADLPLAASATGAATADGALSAVLEVASSAAGTSTADGSVIADVTLAATAAGTSSTTATMDVAGTQELVVNVTAGATVSGGLIVDFVLEGTAPGTATATADATVDRPLAGEADGAATTTADLSQQIEVEGAAAGDATATGSVAVDILLAATATGSATATADMSVAGDITLDGVAAGTSTASADMVVERGLLGAAAGAATATGSVERVIDMAGVISGAALAEAELLRVVAIAGEADGDSAAAADIALLIGLAGLSAGSSMNSGGLTMVTTWTLSDVTAAFAGRNQPSALLVEQNPAAALSAQSSRRSTLTPREGPSADLNSDTRKATIQ